METTRSNHPAVWSLTPDDVSPEALRSTPQEINPAVQAFWSGLRARITGAPSSYALDNWRDTVRRLSRAETVARRTAPHSSSGWDVVAMPWLAEVAVLEGASVRQANDPYSRIRLAKALVAMQTPERGDTTDVCTTMARQVWWAAEHFNGWFQRDQGPVHTAQRAASFSRLMGQFAGGCADVWAQVQDPVLVDAAVLALRIATVPLQAQDLLGMTGFSPVTRSIRREQQWVGRIDPDARPLPMVLEQAWATTTQGLDRALCDAGAIVDLFPAAWQVGLTTMIGASSPALDGPSVPGHPATHRARRHGPR